MTLTTKFHLVPRLRMRGAVPPLSRTAEKPERDRTSRVAFEAFAAMFSRSSIYWDITPCSPLKANDVSEEYVAPIFRDLFATYFLLFPCLAYSLTLNIEEIYSSETLVYFQRTTRVYIPEDRILHISYGLISLKFRSS
jgi:hypothetical protein